MAKHFPAWAVLSMRPLLLFTLSVLILNGTARAAEDEGASNTFVDALLNGKPIVDIRLRYEHVDQAGLPNNANALTLRSRLGYETAAFHDIKLLFELENITAIGAEDFNDTVNGNTAFPVVADPEATELNRAQITYTGFENTTLTGGRQRILLDNQRFFGNVGWRQNEQTFDAFRIDNASLENLDASYIYIGQAQRIFGDDSAFGEFTGDTHALNATYSGLPFGDLTGYVYLIDINEIARFSSANVGFRLSGSQPLNDVTLTYAAEYAHQRDYEDNPADFNLNYYAFQGGAAYQSWSAAVGVEVLGGNGTSAFQTPYATLHAFQGFADVFLVTPPDGIQDIYASIGYVRKNVGPIDKLAFKAIYHDFNAEEIDLDYGREIDLILSATFFEHLTLLAKYANYDANGFSVDTERFWLQAQVSF